MAESDLTSNPFHQDDNARDTGLGEQMESSARDVHDTVEHALQGAERGAAEGLHKVRDTAARAGKRVKSSLTHASDYVTSMDAGDMWGDVKELARRNPAAWMLTVAVIGFAIGRTTSRRSR